MAVSWQGSEWGWSCNPIVFYKVSHSFGQHFQALCWSCPIMSSDTRARSYKSSTSAGNTVSGEKVQGLPRWWSRSGAGVHMCCARRELCLLIKKNNKQTNPKCSFPLMNCVEEDGNEAWNTEEERCGELLEHKCKAPGELVPGPWRWAAASQALNAAQKGGAKEVGISLKTRISCTFSLPF